MTEVIKSPPRLVKETKFIDATRYAIEVQPYGASALSAQGTTEVKFRLPKQDFIFGTDIILYLNCEVDGDGASDDSLLSNICTIWEQFVVRIDSEQHQQISEYGFLQSLDDNLRHTAEYRTSFGAIAQGIPALSSSGVSVRYGMRLLYNNFLDRIIPAYKVGTIEVEFTLNNQLAEYTHATTAVTEIDVTLMSLHVPYVKSEAMVKEWNSKDMVSTYFDYNHSRDNSLLSGATSHTMVIPTSHKSLTGLLCVMRATADINDPNFASGGGEKYEHAMITNALTSLDFVIDGSQIPRRSINCNQQVENFQYLLEYAGHVKNDDFSAPAFYDTDYSTATDGIFVIAMPFNTFLSSTSILSGINTSQATGQIEMNLKAITASANTTIDVWTRYDKVVNFTRDGQVLSTK